MLQPPRVAIRTAPPSVRGPVARFPPAPSVGTVAIRIRRPRDGHPRFEFTGGARREVDRPHGVAAQRVHLRVSRGRRL